MCILCWKLKISDFKLMSVMRGISVKVTHQPV